MEGAPDKWSAQAVRESAALVIEAPAIETSANAPPARLQAVGADKHAHREAVRVMPWQGAPSARAYARRLILPMAAVGLASLAIGSAFMWLSFRGADMFVYPLVGVLAIALGVYGLFVRPVLVVRACRRVRYRIDDRGVEVLWSPERRILTPADRVPPFTVVRARRGRALTDVFFAGPSAWVSPWGAWRIVDDTWGLVCLERPEEALAALERLRAASPTPTAWAVGVVTPPRDHVFGPDLLQFLSRLVPWHKR